MIYEYRHPKFTDTGAIDAEINHPVYGWIESTIDQEDNPEFFAAIKDQGEIADYVAPPPPPPPGDADRYLTPAQFVFLLALTGFDEVWDAIEAGAKANDRAQYAALKAEKMSSRFQLARVLVIVDQFRSVAAQIAPDVDLSEAAIRAAWDQAEVFGGVISVR